MYFMHSLNSEHTRYGTQLAEAAAASLAGAFAPELPALDGYAGEFLFGSNSAGSGVLKFVPDAHFGTDGTFFDHDEGQQLDAIIRASFFNHHERFFHGRFGMLREIRRAEAVQLYVRLRDQGVQFAA